jgi:hypothetical protein
LAEKKDEEGYWIGHLQHMHGMHQMAEGKVLKNARR